MASVAETSRPLHVAAPHEIGSDDSSARIAVSTSQTSEPGATASGQPFPQAGIRTASVSSDEESSGVQTASEIASEDRASSDAAITASGETTSGPQQMTLAEIESLALGNNPTLQQLTASVTKARGLQQQVAMKPNPVIGYSGQQLFDDGTDQQLLFVEQEIVTGDKLRLNQRVLNQSVQVQLWELEAQRLRVLTDVRIRFYQALTAQAQVELTDSIRDAAEKAVQVTQQRLAALESSQVDVLQAEIQFEEFDLQHRQALIRLEAARQSLVAATGLPGLKVGTLAGDLTPQALEMDWSQVLGHLLASSPELNAARCRVTEARAMYQRQTAQATPNPTVSLAGGPDNGTGTGMLNVQIGIPVPVHNGNTGNIRAAWADYCRATHEVLRLEAALQARLAEAAARFDSAAATVRRYEQQILPKAAETLRLSEQARTAGEFNSLQVLIVERTWFEAGLVHIAAQGTVLQTQALVDGLLLSGGLDAPPEFNGDDALRGQTFSQQ
jgi:cobalt-zinc-cadmium efflux system outer membrane protein